MRMPKRLSGRCVACMRECRGGAPRPQRPRVPALNERQTPRWRCTAPSHCWTSWRCSPETISVMRMGLLSTGEVRVLRYPSLLSRLCALRWWLDINNNIACAALIAQTRTSNATRAPPAAGSGVSRAARRRQLVGGSPVQTPPRQPRQSLALFHHPRPAI